MPSSSNKQRTANKPAQPGGFQEYWQAIRSFSPSLQRFIISMALILVTAFGLQPVLQNLYLLRLGFDVQFIGLLAGIGQIAWAAAAIPAGMLGNRLGLRNSLSLGCGLFGLGLALFLLVESLPVAQWQGWLMGSQVIFWFGVALLTVNGAPYLMAVTSEGERRHAFAVYSASGPTVAFIGSLIGGGLPGLLADRLALSLDQPEPYRWALWPGVVLACGAIAVLTPAEPANVTRQTSHEQSATPAPWLLLAFIGSLSFLGACSEGAVRTFFNVYLDSGFGMAPATIGTVMGLAQLLPIGAALAVPLLVNRMGTGYALVTGMAGIAIFLAALASTALAWLVIAMYMIVVAMNTIRNTTRDLFGQELFTARWRTASQSIGVVGMALGWALAGIGGGALIQARGFGILYFIGALAALLGAGVLFGYLRLGHTQPSRLVEVAAVTAEEQSIP